jgi:hypothetical protein
VKAPQLPAARWDLFKHWQSVAGAAYEALIADAWKGARRAGFYEGRRLNDVRDQIGDAAVFRLADEITTRKFLGQLEFEAWQYFVAHPKVDCCLDGENPHRTRRQRINAVQPADVAAKWDYV